MGCKVLLIAILYDIEQLSSNSSLLQQQKHHPYQLHIQQLLEWIQQQNTILPNNECELLYGRVGMIQTIVFLRDVVQQPQLGTPIVLIMAQTIIQNGRQLSSSKKQLLFVSSSSSSSSSSLELIWTWHTKCYLGAAHGIVGILQILLSLHAEELAQLPMDSIRRTIDQLSYHYTHKSGNLESSCCCIQQNTTQSNIRSDRLVQWCHGAVGHVLLLIKAAHIYQNESYIQMAEQIVWNVIWPRGLLKKGVGLCHGISGNAYTFLALSRYYYYHHHHYSTKEQQFRLAAELFGQFAVQHLDELEHIPDRPYSLFEGLGGLCALAMDLINTDHPPSFPLYEF